MISNLDNLIDIFNKMKADGFDTVLPLKRGFYFVDTDKEKLQNVFNELKDSDYILEDIYLTDDSCWTLHASKIDTLTPETLHRRNNAFNELADFCNIDLYDGWDVEKISN
jgi:hypothetical protein